jgi:hypothetical protein
MAQVVVHLPRNHETLNSTPSTTKKNFFKSQTWKLLDWKELLTIIVMPEIKTL